MFSYSDGEWQLIRRLERVYSETETDEDPRWNMEYHAVESYRELYYRDGELVEEKERKRPWGRPGMEGVVPLYPVDGEKW